MARPIHFANRNIGEWPSLEVSNHLIGLSIVPSIGGRIIDLSLGDVQVFYSNPRVRGKAIAVSTETKSSVGRNYGGSKVWAAPQGWSSEQQWPGPPDPVLDCGAYAWHATVDPRIAVVTLQSTHDEYTGLTIRREIELRSDSSSVEVLHTMQNTSRRAVRWSIWQVTQVDAAQGLEIFVPATGFHQTFGDKTYDSVSFCATEKRLRVNYEDQVAKLAVEANQGWFASLDHTRGFVLAETFPVTPGASYPDGAPVAFWISGHGTFTLHGDQVDMGTSPDGCDPHVETEIMSPLTDLAPGESFQLRTAWHLAAIDAQQIISLNRCGAVGASLAVHAGSPTRFRGSFASFWEGKLQLVAYDRASRVLGTFEMGEVSPRRPVLLDSTVPLPPQTVRCSLMVFDHSYKQLGVLDRVNIQ